MVVIEGMGDNLGRAPCRKLIEDPPDDGVLGLVDLSFATDGLSIGASLTNHVIAIGIAAARFELGGMHESGRGVPKDGATMTTPLARRSLGLFTRTLDGAFVAIWLIDITSHYQDLGQIRINI